jgi:glycosyltransferase involved in cell wall biosynthesis
MNRLSVIIPAYKSAGYLSETLQSVFRQTLLPDEIIVVDDCSPDETQAVVKSLQVSAPVDLKLIVLEKNSGGPVSPMNTGVSAARGKFIAMLDHDDRMLPQRLERALPPIQADERIGVVFNQFDFFDEHRAAFKLWETRYDHLGNTPKRIPAAEAERMLITQGFPYGGAGGMLFRKKAWLDVDGFRPKFRIVWDYDFGLRVAAQGWDTYYLPDNLYQHRQHANNLETSEGGWRNSLEHFELFHELLPKQNLSQEVKDCLRQKIEKYVFRVADAEVLRKNYQRAAYYYWQALQNGRQRYRALRGFLRLPYRYGRECLGLSNKHN